MTASWAALTTVLIGIALLLGGAWRVSRRFDRRRPHLTREAMRGLERGS